MHFLIRQGTHATVCLALFAGGDIGAGRWSFGLGRRDLLDRHQSVMIDVCASQRVDEVTKSGRYDFDSWLGELDL